MQFMNLSHNFCKCQFNLFFGGIFTSIYRMLLEMVTVLFRFQRSTNLFGKENQVIFYRSTEKTLGGVKFNLAKLAVFQIWARQLFRISPNLAKTVVACFQPLHDQTLFGHGVIFLLKCCKHRVSTIAYCMLRDVNLTTVNSSLAVNQYTLVQ